LILTGAFKAHITIKKIKLPIKLGKAASFKQSNGTKTKSQYFKLSLFLFNQKQSMLTIKSKSLLFFRQRYPISHSPLNTPDDKQIFPFFQIS